LSTVISAIQLMVASPVAGSAGEMGYSTTRWRSRAQADERRAAADGHARRGAAPHDGAAPLDGRLLRVHLRAHRRMQAVGGHQQAPVSSWRWPSRSSSSAVTPSAVVAVAGDALAQAHRIGPRRSRTASASSICSCPRCTAYCGQR
jgi:hypothetical protein